MLLEVATLSEGTCLKLSGELDASESQELDSRLDVLLPELRTDVTLDLSALISLNSLGLRSFLRLDKALKAQGRSITIKGALPSVYRVFRYCGLDTYFRFVDTYGVQALAGQAD